MFRRKTAQQSSIYLICVLFYDIGTYSLLGKFIALAALQLMKPVGDPFFSLNKHEPPSCTVIQVIRSGLFVNHFKPNKLIPPPPLVASFGDYLSI